jgi:photosystem II stability/assembly factor-like uncharacterized protein
MIALSRIVALGCVGLVACGHGGGGGEAETVRLAVGYRTVEAEPDEVNTRGIILRNQGRGWTAVGEDVLDEDALGDVLFTSGDIAWAYGSHTLVRSTDGGSSWEDIRPRLPEMLREGPYVFHSLAFADAATGYLAVRLVTNGGLPTVGPFVWITRNGGETWEAAEDLTPRLNEIGITLATRAGEPEILRHTPTGDVGAVVQAFDGADRPIEPLTALPTVIIKGFDTVGESGWVAVTVIPGDDSAHSRPLILTSARRGESWTAQTVPDVEAQDFGYLDMCDAHFGLAGGSVPPPEFRPLIFWTDDGGLTWQSSAMPAIDDGFTVTEVTCVEDDEMWVLASQAIGPSPEGALLRSDDGGRSFSRVEVSSDERPILLGLTSNAAFQ